MQLPYSDELKLVATMKSLIILCKHGSVKQYEDNIKALLNNPQWRNKIRSQRDDHIHEGHKTLR